MTQWTRLRPAALAALAVLVAAAAGAAESGPPFIGFRGDNTGVFPDDCEPVTAWNEWDFKEVGEGRKKDLVPEKANPVNLVWKTPLAQYCNGGMVVAGGKLFLLVDPGGIGFAGKVEPDFLGVKLVCMDPADGQILWTRDLHHNDCLPEEVRGKVEKALAEERAFYYKVLGAHLRWYKACWQRTKEAPPPPEEHAELYRKAAEEYRQYVPVPATLKEQRASKEWKASGYVQCMFWDIKKKYLKEAREREKFLRDYGYEYNDFFGQASFIEQAMATPVSDGRRLYVTTYHGDAFCYELDGTLVWKQWYGYHLDRLGGITSPTLVGDLMIMAGREVDEGGNAGAPCWMAVDKATGKVVWRTPRQGGGSYTCASPTHHRLAIGGDASKTLDVLWCPTGQVLRVRDGKVLLTEIGSHGNSRPWAVDGDVLVINNGSSDGGGSKAQRWDRVTAAFRLKAESEDRVVCEDLWVGDDDDLVRLVARDGVLYGFRDRRQIQARDIVTGEVLASAGLPGRFVPHHLSVLAGHHLFAVDDDGRCLVAEVNDELKVLGINQLGTRVYKKYDFFCEGAQAFFSGNRIFFRSYTDVYCIGDPDAPMRLSKAHQ